MMMTQIGGLGGPKRPQGLKLKPLLELQPDRFEVTQDPNNPLLHSVRLLGTAPVSVTIAPAVPGLQRDEAPPASTPLQPAVPYQHPFRWFCTVCQQTYEGKVPTGEAARTHIEGKGHQRHGRIEIAAPMSERKDRDRLRKIIRQASSTV